MEGLHIYQQILDAVKTIHEKNIIHRDLKPANIMLVEKDKDKHFVKLLDFGLAKMKHQTQVTQSGIMVGTISYMAPEQILGSDFSLAGDIYSLGVILFEITTGRKPFEGNTKTNILRQILKDTPPEAKEFRKDLPDALNGLINWMLAKEAKDRPTINDVIEQVQ